MLQLTKNPGSPSGPPIWYAGWYAQIFADPTLKKWKEYFCFDKHSSGKTASSGTIGHKFWQQKFLGHQSDQYLGMSGLPDHLISRIWWPLSCSMVCIFYCDFTTVLQSMMTPTERSLLHEHWRKKYMFFSCIDRALVIRWRLTHCGLIDAIWRQRSGSSLTQVMACCLMAPSHYLNQCWLITSMVQWHSYEGSFTRDTSAIDHYNQLKNYSSKIYFESPRGQWVK